MTRLEAPVIVPELFLNSVGIAALPIIPPHG
jgi:hypothetical protein